MARITRAEAQAAAQAYAQACVNTGILTEEQAEQVTISAPYGQVHYLVRYDKTEHRYDHDLVGFGGSGGSGSLSLRDLVEQVRFATGMIYDMSRAQRQERS